MKTSCLCSTRYTYHNEADEREIKHKDNDIKTKLKERENDYKVFDNKSSEYMEKMLASTEDKKKMFEGLFSDEDVLESDTVKALSLFVDVSVQDIMDKIVKDNVEDRNNFKYYLYVLLVLAYIHDLEDMDNEKKNILLRKTVQLMSTVNDTPMTDEMLEEQLDDILDDDIKTVLRERSIGTRFTRKSPLWTPLLQLLEATLRDWSF